MFYFLYNKFRLFLRDHIRCLYCIWYARNKRSWWKTRFLLNVFAGVFLTWLLCKLILLSFFFSKENEDVIIRYTVITVGLGFIFTDAVKCILFLMFVALLGKSGRSYLRALCFAFIIAGPIQNLSVNVGEVVRVFSCSVVLTYNLTRTRYDLMTRPFQRTLSHMKDDIEEVKDTFHSLKDVTYAVHEEIMGDELVSEDLAVEAETAETAETTLKPNTTVIMESIDNVAEVAPINQTTTEETIAEAIFQDDDDFNENSTQVINNITASSTSSSEVDTNLITTTTTTSSRTPVDSNLTTTTPSLTTQIKSNITEEPHEWFLQLLQRTKRQHLLKRNDPSHPDPKYVQDKYTNKLRKRCIKQLDKGKERCSKAFQATYDKCYDALPIILNVLLCWPMKIDFICRMNFLGDPDSLCDPSDAIPDNVGETYADLNNVEENLYSESSNVQVSYNVMSIESSPELQSAKETAHEVMQEFNARKRIFDAFLTLMQRFLAFMIIWVLFSCYRYHKKYKKDIQFDNIYITDYFKHLDERRQKECKDPVLPLKKYERRNIVVLDESVWHRSTEESRELMFHLFQFLMEMFTGWFFLFLDYIIATILAIIRDHSEIEFVQDGEHNIKFFIEGSGLIARLLRSTMHNFNMHETVHTELSNKQCLPKPSKLPESFYIKLFLLYATVLFLIYQSTAFLRLRRTICSYFYRKQEKRRIIFLYNSLMKQRRTLIKKMIQQAKMNYVNRQVRRKANPLLRLRLECPTYFGWLVRFKMARRKCFICDEYEDMNFVLCDSPQCGAVYCHECWLDMGDKCLICNGVISENIIINFSDFFEEFTFVSI